MKTLNVLDFDSIEDFIDEIVNNVVDEDEYIANTVVCTYDLAIELMHKILAIKESFDSVDIDTSMTGFYYVTITSDFELYCQPICYDGKCMWNESEYTYIQECIPRKFEKYFGDKWKVIFGIKE